MTGSGDGDDSLERALADLRALYAELALEIERAGVRCALRGACCDFASAAHVLFATSLEVEHARRNGGAAPAPAAPSACPFHVQDRCLLRAGRPLGCRVYFCDPDFAERMHELAARYHDRVARIHEEHGISYEYGRFVEMIRRPPRARGAIG
ncbi:MAG: hypothetical protein HY812_00960 [Planctomycetes bacterium]|nr:hypothetical protein [Planctomycetota bacterium]